MDPVTHAAAGAVLALAMPQRPQSKLFVPWAALTAAFPDVDVFVAHTPLEFLLLHRGITHALAALPVEALLLGLVGVMVCGVRGGAGAWGLVRASCCALLLLASHVWLDCVTTYGTMIFLPFSDMRVRLNGLFIVDIMLIAPLLWALLRYWQWQRHKQQHGQRAKGLGGGGAQSRVGSALSTAAVVPSLTGTTGITRIMGTTGAVGAACPRAWVLGAAVWIFLYPALCVGARVVLEDMMRERLAAAGHEVTELAVLSDVFAPVFWRVVYTRNVPYTPDAGSIADAGSAPGTGSTPKAVAPADMFHFVASSRTVYQQGLWLTGTLRTEVRRYAAAEPAEVARLAAQSYAARAFFHFTLQPVSQCRQDKGSSLTGSLLTEKRFYDLRFDSMLALVVDLGARLRRSEPVFQFRIREDGGQARAWQMWGSPRRDSYPWYPLQAAIPPVWWRDIVGLH